MADLGRIRPVPKGQYSSTTKYEVLDIVTDSGNSQIARKNDFSGIDLSNTEYWLQLSTKGDKGDKGDAGETPAFAVSDITGGHKITITLGDKIEEIELQDGYTPQISETTTGKNHTVTITVGSKTTTFTVKDGADGAGSGDMRASDYDADGDGQIDYAESAGGLSAGASINQNQVTGLSDALEGKAASSHRHSASDIEGMPESITITTSVTQGSTDAVSSGAVYDAIDKLDIPEGIVVDTTLDKSSNNAISNAAVKTALDAKAASSHAHGDITNAGAIGSAADCFIVTGASGKLTAITTSSALSKIGAAKSSHNQGANTITTGTFPAKVQAMDMSNLTQTNLYAGQIRNIIFGTGTPTATTCPIGCIYLKIGDAI